MLWTAFVNAVGMFLHWRVYAAGLIYLIIALGPTFLLAYLDNVGGTGLLFFVQPLFHALGLMTFVALVAPIALGFGGDVAWSLPLKLVSNAPGAVSKDVVLLVIVSVGIAFVPVLGNLPSFNTLVLGVVATGMVFKLAGVEGITRSDLIPSLGIWFGLLILGGAVSILGSIAATVVSGIVASLFGHRGDDDSLAAVISFPIIAVMGFAPLVLYLSWLGVSLH